MKRPLDSFEETRELLRSAKPGGDASLERLVAKYGRTLLHSVREMLGKQARAFADSEDLLQELFVDVVRAYDPEHFSSEEEFLRWARHLARNNVRDAARRARLRAMERFVSSIVTVVDDDSGGDGPYSRVSRAEMRVLLGKALASLPDEMRRAIELRAEKGLAWADIAAELDRPSPEAARALHARGLARLTTELRRLA